MSPRKQFEILRPSLDYALSDEQSATIENAIAAAEAIRVPALRERAEENLKEHFKHITRAEGFQLVTIERLLRNIQDLDRFLVHLLVQHINACIFQQNDAALHDLVEAGCDFDSRDFSGSSSLKILVTNANLMNASLQENIERLLWCGARATLELIDLAEHPVTKATLTAAYLRQQAMPTVVPPRIRRKGVQ